MKKYRTLFLLFLLMLCVSCSSHNEGINLGAPDTFLEQCMPLLLPNGISGAETNQEGPIDIPQSPVKWQLVSTYEQNRFSHFELLAIHRTASSDQLLLRTNESEIVLLDSKGILLQRFDTNGNYLLPFESSNKDLWLYRPTAFNTIQISGIQGKELQLNSVKTNHEVRNLYQIASGPQSTWITFDANDGLYYLGELILEAKRPYIRNAHALSIEHPNSSLENWKIRDNSKVLGLAIDRQNRPYISYETNNRKYVVTYRLEPDEKFVLVHVARIDGDDYGLRWGFGTYIDENDILWIGDIAWANVGDEPIDYYNQSAMIYRSPVFVARTPPGDAYYRWLHGTPTADTPDGRIWYKSLRGTAWYQPENGEWCMFSSSQSPVLKDSEGNLWMTYDNGLYMLPAEETKAKSK